MSDPSRPARGGTQDLFFPVRTSSTMPTIVAGDGIHLIDDRGRRLLDVASGPFLASLGQGNERVLQAMLEQGRRLTYTYSRTTRHAANARLAEQLASLAGAGFERVHLTSGGSEAVEMALKFFRQHAVATGQAERHRVISMMPGYHGATTQTLGLNGDVTAPALWGPHDRVVGQDPGAAHLPGDEPCERRRREQRRTRGGDPADRRGAGAGLRHGADRWAGIRGERTAPVVRS